MLPRYHHGAPCYPPAWFPFRDCPRLPRRRPRRRPSSSSSSSPLLLSSSVPLLAAAAAAVFLLGRHCWCQVLLFAVVAALFAVIATGVPLCSAGRGRWQRRGEILEWSGARAARAAMRLEAGRRPLRLVLRLLWGLCPHRWGCHWSAAARLPAAMAFADAGVVPGRLLAAAGHNKRCTNFCAILHCSMQCFAISAARGAFFCPTA